MELKDSSLHLSQKLVKDPFLTCKQCLLRLKRLLDMSVVLPPLSESTALRALTIVGLLGVIRHYPWLSLPGEFVLLNLLLPA